MTDVRVLVQNVVTQGDADRSVFFSPVWVGFHDGTFDSFDEGQAASEAIERVAEDAIFTPAGDFSETISTEFGDGGAGFTTAGVIFGPDGPFSQGSLGVSGFDVDGTQDKFLSYASMILPSNDAFIANDDPTRENLEIFDEDGNFIGTDFTVRGSRVWDAGTEDNDEVFSNTAALGQTAAIEDANTGDDENGTVQFHPGFLGSERLGGEAGGILTAREDADFTTENDGANFDIARITVLEDIVGDAENNRISGTALPDAMFGAGGNDTLNGLAGRDWLVGGFGNDLLRGGVGDDVLEGRPGNDRLLGGSGDDIVSGGQGRDRLNGGAGNDTLMGGASIDFFIFNTNETFDTNDVGIDTIKDFNRGQDLIILDKTTFDAITSDPSSRTDPGFSVSSEFALVANDDAAATADALIVQSIESGNLFYNQNGAAADFGDGGQFATGLPALGGNDFIIRG